MRGVSVFYEPQDMRDGFTALARVIVIKALSDASNGSGEALKWLLHPATEDTFLRVAEINPATVRDYILSGFPRFRFDGERIMRQCHKSNRSRDECLKLVVLAETINAFEADADEGEEPAWLSNPPVPNAPQR